MKHAVRSGIAWMAVLALALMVVGCKPPPSEEGEEEASSSEADLTLAVVPKGTVHAFWQTVKAGAEAAGKEFGAKIEWNGPAVETDFAGQIRIIEDFISSGVDGLVMAACDAKSLVDVVKKAQAKDIKVVTIDSGLDPDVSTCFVATDNEAGAAKAADKLAELIPEGGPVGLIPFVPGAATSIARENGFKQGLAKHPKLKLVSTLYCQSDVSRGMSVTEDMLTSYPDLKGIFAANEPGAIGAANALEQRGKAGQVKLVAFDAEDSEIEALRKGTIQALIVQNPFKMGYDGVRICIDAIHGEPDIPKRIDTGVTVVTKDNLDDPEVQKILHPLDHLDE